MSGFTHLHLHTQYSILDGAAKIPKLMEKAKSDGMEAIAITDHGNMFGVLEFTANAQKNDLKPIIGCEIYVAHNSRDKKESKDDRSGYHLILLAKNRKGYHNLCKLVSMAYIEGFYYTPRVDKALLKKYSEGLIAMTACLGGEVPRSILKNDPARTEKIINEYLGIFGDDFYFELMRHGLEDQDIVNKELIALSRKHDVKLVATNDVHYINREDFEAHHILVCLNTGKDVNDQDSLMYSGEEYFKTTEEMKELFLDIPEAITNTQDIVRKIENFDIVQNVVMPHFPLPENMENDDDYLEYLVWEGAKKRYPDLSDAIRERLTYELSVIKDLKFAGYFLIVQDFINEARRMGVIVGPGRGSAAGSAVAYAIGITDIDPIRFNLLFERFLNPERKSMPDMDIDFDDYGREKVIQYVVEKYGANRVAHIITFGSMAARSSIRDVGRVLKLPLSDTDRLAKLVPEDAGMTLDKAFNTVPELKKELDEGLPLVRKTLNFARILEGSTRHTGIHACGMIIGDNDLIESIPLCTSKETSLMITQYEGSVIESAGMLKMDFLGLKTLTIMKDTIDNIRKAKGIEVRIDEIPLDDEQTFELFRNGYTLGTFQFESDGMRTYLKELKPTDIEDLIAMNALYRPGPIEQIPVYIQRKYGHEKVDYINPLLEEVLKPTYGIFIYQEQIIKAVQVVANYTPGAADDFRRAIGKKKAAVIEENKIRFIEGAEKNNVSRSNAEYIYERIEKFANYGFNRSHAAAYSVVALQTAYFKAHYPAYYMAAVLAHNMGDLKKLNLYIGECRRMGIMVLGPDINESDYKFTVIHDTVIRFGLGAIKGVGEAAVESIISERAENGSFTDLYEMTTRINPRAVNKKCFEALACAGAFDSFPNAHRAQYFYTEPNDDQNTIDKAIKFGQKVRDMKSSLQTSLFGDNEMEHVSIPVLPVCDPWNSLEVLKNEREYLGYYVSGHPLDEYEVDMKYITTTTIEDYLDRLQSFLNIPIILGGMVTEFTERYTKTGAPYGVFVVEDYTSKARFSLFQEKYLKFKHLLGVGTKILIRLMVVQRFKNASELVPDFMDVILLSDARTRFFKKITLQMDLMKLTTELKEKIVKLVKDYPGECRLMLEFVHSNGNNSLLHLKMTPQKLMVDPSNEFFKALDNLNELTFKVN